MSSRDKEKSISVKRESLELALFLSSPSTGESRGFAFVRYKYTDEVQKAVERLDGRTADGQKLLFSLLNVGQMQSGFKRVGLLKPFQEEEAGQETAALGEVSVVISKENKINNKNEGAKTTRILMQKAKNIFLAFQNYMRKEALSILINVPYDIGISLDDLINVINNAMLNSSHC
ncbi:hypothetical protein L1049_022854 [Liquidambar formosana]|uniref:RRM domain-containing protein n=1 Tax=Liquidambar formosana TaxID=63359 RepID=A0AAP0WP87_LIQFO